MLNVECKLNSNSFAYTFAVKSVEVLLTPRLWAFLSYFLHRDSLWAIESVVELHQHFTSMMEHFYGEKFKAVIHKEVVQQKFLISFTDEWLVNFSQIIKKWKKVIDKIFHIQ